MATQAIDTLDTRTNRLVVLLSNREKRAIEDGARAASMSLSEYVRTAAQSHAEPTEAEQALIEDLLVELEAANVRTDEAFARLEATEARAAAFDEEAIKAETRARLLVDGEVDWGALREMLAPVRGSA